MRVFQVPLLIGKNFQSAFAIIISKLLGHSTTYLSNYLRGCSFPASFVHGYHHTSEIMKIALLFKYKKVNNM